MKKRPAPKPRAGRPTESDTILARARRVLGMSQGEAAAVCAALLGKCGRRTYQRWESEGGAPPVIYIEFNKRLKDLK